MFRCSKAWIALCEPQPGQRSPPVSIRNGHFGKKAYLAGSNDPYITIAATPPIIIDSINMILFILLKSKLRYNCSEYYSHVYQIIYDTHDQAYISPHICFPALFQSIVVISKHI